LYDDDNENILVIDRPLLLEDEAQVLESAKEISGLEPFSL
jgi:hypothetical protein